ncbi:LOW QUALITY PROTEIN: cytosolic Fe-S cluster assembly factor NUBP1 homolog [Scylla paramamosain]|uniref:LOW QUALITY PROTEIN: cytosolic Fe-S cluster assembly factor NUBP1 homolog n=1 Tax=Scylla paramamosain TaxID=85552 RepID=UPI003082811D
MSQPVDLMYGSLAVESSVLLECGRGDKAVLQDTVSHPLLLVIPVLRDLDEKKLVEGLCEVEENLVVVRERLASVKNKVLVLSGKGGLGKSTVSAMLGLTLAFDDSKEVGFLDIDICGPSQPRVLGTAEEKVHSSGVGWCPVVGGNFQVPIMCLTIWLSCPLGSCSTVQTTLSSGRDPRKMEVALLDVRKEITFCRKVNIPIIGLVENMTTFVCPKCKTKTAVFPATTGCDPQLAEDTEMPLLGQLPLDPRVAQACDEGTNIPTQEPGAAVTQAYKDIANKIKEYCDAQSQEAT